MIRTDIRRRIPSDMRGKISTGKKSDKGYPMSLDYFNVESFPELMAVYGEKPDKLILFFPSNNIEEFYNTQYNTYNFKQTKIRFCDGETCVHCIDETINGIAYASGEESKCVCKELPDDSKISCHCYMSLKAFIANLDGILISPMTYFFESRSVNSADNVFSEIEKIWQMYGGKLMGIPFALSVKMVQGKEAKSRFPIWNLQAIGTTDQLNKFAEIGKLPTLPVKQTEAPEKEEPPKQIEEPKVKATNEEFESLRVLAGKVKGYLKKEDMEYLKIIFNKNEMTKSLFLDWQTRLTELKKEKGVE